MKKPVPCPECGSTNTELRGSLPGATMAEDLKNRLLSVARFGAGRKLPGAGPQGMHYLVCKDCGAVSCISVL